MSQNWDLKKLGDVIKLEYGKPLPKENRFEDGKYPAYGANGIKCRTNDSFWDKPSIIVGRKGSAGEVNLVDAGFWPLDVTYYVTFDEHKYDLKFLFYILKWLNLTTLAKGVKPGINRNDVYSIQQSFPELQEQKRIVAILDEAFAGISQAIANAEKNLANARELFESYLNNIFTQKGEGWVEKSLGEVIHITHGFSFKGADFEVSENEDRPIVLTPGNYTEDATLRFNKKNTKRLMIDPPNGYEFDEGDLTIVMTDLSSKMKILGKPALIKRKGILHNQRIGRILFNDTSIRKQYLYYYLQTRKVSDTIKFTATGTMVRHTAPSRILSNKIAFPVSNGEQDEIVKELDLLKKKAQQLETIYQKKLEALAELKQSILQKAFAGELH